MNLTTQLEAVNTLLATIGESPVNALDSGLVEATQAEQTLANISREVQSKGWSFNTDLSFTLTPDSNGELQLPYNCLSVDTTATRRSSTSDLVQRGMRLYDRVQNTYAIDETMEVDIVVLLKFEELPESVRHYITVRAARVLQDRYLGSDSLHTFNSKDEQSAWQAIVQTESEIEDFNIFDNQATSMIAHAYR